MRVLQGLGIAVDRGAGNAGRAEAAQPMGDAVPGKQRRQQRRQRRLIGRAQGRRGKARVGQQLGGRRQRAHLLPQLVVARRQRKPAVRRRVGLVRGVARVGRAEWLRVLAGAKVLAGLQRRDRQRGGEHRDVELAARPAAAHPCQQGGDAEGGIQASGKVDHRHAGLDRGATGLAGDAHHAGAGLDGQIKSALAAARAVLAVGRDRAVNQPGLARAEPIPTEAEPAHGAWPVVFHQHVGLLHQRARQVALRRLLQVQHHRLLAPVECGKVFTEALAQRRPLAHGIALGRLDFGDRSAKVRQQHAAKRAGRDMAKLDDLDAVQGLGRQQHGDWLGG